MSADSQGSSVGLMLFQHLNCSGVFFTLSGAKNSIVALSRSKAGEGGWGVIVSLLTVVEGDEEKLN
ncbi:hypothetical protein G1O98_31185 [Nostoc sp. UIC10630]|nr:hypothetical protein [Nostoc sp. UIC 10630]